jgi:hypothetical protein
VTEHVDNLRQLRKQCFSLLESPPRIGLLSPPFNVSIAASA